MDNVLCKVDELISELNTQEMIIKMRKDKEIILKNNLLYDYNNSIVREYNKEVNELNLYLFYMNTELKKIIKR